MIKVLNDRKNPPRERDHLVEYDDGTTEWIPAPEFCAYGDEIILMYTFDKLHQRGLFSKDGFLRF